MHKEEGLLIKIRAVANKTILAYNLNILSTFVFLGQVRVKVK